MSNEYKTNAEYERQEKRNVDSWTSEASNTTDDLFNRILSLRDDINTHLDYYSSYLDDDDYYILGEIVKAVEEFIPAEVQTDYKEKEDGKRNES